MENYETAKFAAEYIWNKFRNPRANKKAEVLDLLEGYITRKLDEEGTVNLYFVSCGNMDRVSKYCSQEALVFEAIYFDLIITKESVIDYKSGSVEPVFKVSAQKK